MAEEIKVLYFNGELFVNKGAIQITPHTKVHWKPVTKGLTFTVDQFECVEDSNAPAPFDKDHYTSSNDQPTDDGDAQDVDDFETLVYKYRLHGTMQIDGRIIPVSIGSDPVVIIDPPGSDDE